MTTFTTKTLVDNVVYGVPSGNYDGSSQDFFGDPVRAANYYGGQGSAQTAMIQTTGFVGELRIEATLNDWVQQADWFLVETYGNASTPTTGTQAISMLGNFVWLRARVVDFTAGTINSANVIF